MIYYSKQHKYFPKNRLFAVSYTIIVPLLNNPQAAFIRKATLKTPREDPMYRPFEQFHITGNCISVIGSGGKTTLLGYLAGRLPGTVILTTSTHIFPFPGIPLVKAGGEGISGLFPTSEQKENPSALRDRVLHEIRSAFKHSRVICVGQPLSSGKLASPSAHVPFETLLEEADYCLVEADGASGRPLKAHRPWEPVIPACSSLTVGVVGACGIGKIAKEACHCPDLFCALTGISPEQPVSAEHIAEALNKENLADCYLVNQADALPDPEQARKLCDLIRKDAYLCSLAPR